MIFAFKEATGIEVSVYHSESAAQHAFYFVLTYIQTRRKQKQGYDLGFTYYYRLFRL